MNLTFEEYSAQARLTPAQQDTVRALLRDPSPDPRPFEEWSLLVSRLLSEQSFSSGGSSWPGQDLRRDLVTGVYDPVDLVATATEGSLAPHVPEGATHCLISVTGGVMRLGMRRANTAPAFAERDLIRLSGLQLAGARFIREGSVDAPFRVEFWRVD